MGLYQVMGLYQSMWSVSIRDATRDCHQADADDGQRGDGHDRHASTRTPCDSHCPAATRHGRAGRRLTRSTQCHSPGRRSAHANDSLRRDIRQRSPQERGRRRNLERHGTDELADHGRGNRIDPVTSTTLYAGTSDRGVLKSVDGGVTWSATGLNGVVQALMTDPGTPGTLYAVTDTGAFKSTNAGAGWSPIGPPNARVQALAIAPLSSTTVYAGVSDGVYKSLDGGMNWAPIGLAGHAVSTLGRFPPSLYAVTQNGIFKTTDGVVWSPTDMIPSAMVPVTPTILYSGTPSGAFKSVDGGPWTAVNTGLTDVLLANGVVPVVGPLTIDPLTPATVYAATTFGLFKSWDGAATWCHHLREDECFDNVDNDGDGLIDGADAVDCPLSCFNERLPPGLRLQWRIVRAPLRQRHQRW